MKNIGSRTILVMALAILLFGGSFLSTTSARPSGISGVPNGCICHSGSAADDIVVSLDGVPEFYGDEFSGPSASEFAGQYTLTVSFATPNGPNVTNESVNQGGFNLVASAGTLRSVDNTTQILDGEATHTEYGNDQRSWEIDWIPPAGPDNQDDVFFTLYVNAVNGDGMASTDDHWNKLEVTSIGLCGQHPCETDSSVPGFGFALTLLTLASVAAIRARSAD